MLYLEQPIKKYLDDLSAKLPAPGGGSVAALTGALSASLISMVCNFTIGNPKFASSQEESGGILSSVNEIKLEMSKLIDEDVKAYSKLSLVLKLPKDTGEQKTSREIAVQRALKEAMEIPLRIARLSYALIEKSNRLLEMGNPGLITDTGMAAILACSAMESARLNVEINLAGIKDEILKTKIRSELNSLIEKGRQLTDEVKAKVEAQVVK